LAHKSKLCGAKVQKNSALPNRLIRPKYVERRLSEKPSKKQKKTPVRRSFDTFKVGGLVD